MDMADSNHSAIFSTGFKKLPNNTRTMRKSIIVICVVVLMFCLWLLLHQNGEPTKKGSSEVQASQTKQQSANQVPAIPTQTAQSSSTSKPSAASLAEAEARYRSTPEGSNAFQQRILADWQRPIDFYGKVVDENNQPVEGAAIEFVWTQLFPLPESTPKTNTFSAYDGLFSLNGVTGHSLGVSISKAGYYYVRSLNRDDFSYSTQPGMTPFQPDPNNPVIFHLRKKSSGADLISAGLNVKIPRDGTPVSVDFLNRSFGASGQLQMSQVKPPYESWKKATEWSFKMTIPDGGFVGESDEFPFEAPESGYQPVMDFNFKAGKPDWATDLKKSYYIVFGNPRRYGRLDVLTDIMWGGAQISYAINPDGSRNLEPK